MRVNIESTLAVGVSQVLLNGFDIFSIRLQQGDEGVPIAHPILSLRSFLQNIRMVGFDTGGMNGAGMVSHRQLSWSGSRNC